MKLSDLEPSLPSFSIRILVDLLDEAGLDADAVLSSAGLARAVLSDESLRVKEKQEFAVLRGFARATVNRPDLWVSAGRRYSMFAYNPIGFAQVTAPTLAEAINLTRRFPGLHYLIGNFEEFNEPGGYCGISIRYEKSLTGISDFLLCRDTIGVTTWLHELWGGHFPFLRIDVATDLPSRYGYDYRAPVVSGQKQSRWVWHQSLMQQPPIHVDAVLHKVYLAQCEAIASAAGSGALPADKSSPTDEFLTQIANCIERSERFDLTLDQLAKAMLMSRRSLQRKLAERNLSFRAIIDLSRSRIAQRLVATNERSTGEIAWSLGYANTSSFHQAFMRWSGMTPGAFRRHHRAGIGDNNG